MAERKIEPAGKNVEPVDFPQVSPTPMTGSGADLDFLANVPLAITVKLGATCMTVRDVLTLKKGSVVKLDRLAGEMADLYVNENYLGKAEVIVVGDTMALRVSDLIKSSPDEPPEEG